VAGVGDEGALAVAGAFEAGEHVVEGGAEAVDLVVCDGKREPGLGVDVRDLGGRPAHRVHWSHDGARETVAGECDERER
jgi:hypothetical protein